jgi:hypothetical protein
MASLANNNDVSWLTLPTNNNRTAWAPIGFPVLLIVPHRRNPLGNPIASSGVECVRVYIEGVPSASYVTGQDHIVQTQPTDFCGNIIPGSQVAISQLRSPSAALYSETISATQLADMQIQLSSVGFFRLQNGSYASIDQSQATYGDFFYFIAESGVADYVPYLPDADYFDFSGVAVAVEHLPSDHYVLVYQCQSFARSVTKYGDEQLLCIDTDSVALGILRFPFNHPGEVLDEFYRLTPPVYLTNVDKAQDTTVQLYRPFTDSLQDIYDEQTLLKGINWVYQIPEQYLPYLSELLGWDFPYFPESAEALRRVILLNTSWLQTIKGSQMAVQEMFRILGIDAVVANLWWSADGLRFVRPGDELPAPYQDQQIALAGVYQCEPLLADYQTSGNGGLTIPLIFRPQTPAGMDGFTAPVDGGDVYLNCYLVRIGSDAYNYLTDLVNGDSAHVGAISDPASFSAQRQTQTPPILAGSRHQIQRDFLTDATLYYTIDQRSGDLEVSPKLDGIGGFNQIRIAGDQTGTTASGILGVPLSQVTYQDWAPPPIILQNVSFDRLNNNIGLSFNGYIDFTGVQDLPGTKQPRALFVFAAYSRIQLQVPQALRGLQSNHFDIQLLEAATTPPLAGYYQYVSPALLDFTVEFLNKVKAFHSILNVIQYVVELTDTYEVGGICVGGDILQRYDTMMGRLQVPPAIIPLVPGSGPCAQLDPEALGYKQADIIYRLRKLSCLPDEFAAWQALDNRNAAEVYSVTGTRITPMQPAEGRNSCYFTPHGQDRNPVETYREQTDQVTGPGPNAGQGTTNSDQSARLSPSVLRPDDSFSGIGDQTCTNSDSSEFGSFTRQHDAYGAEWGETDGVTDYCYKGRVQDELLYRPAQLHKETYRNRIRGLSLGTGVYWTYFALSREWIRGTASPVPASHTERPVFTGDAQYAYELFYKNESTQNGRRQSPYFCPNYDQPAPPGHNNFLGLLLRAYGNPETETLHFGNTLRTPHDLTQTSHLSIMRPELGIEKETLHFPGCRFLTLDNMNYDYMSEDWDAKPWDDAHSSPCPVRGQCYQDPTWLNAMLDGDRLVYDSVPFSATGNGQLPDVASLGDHSASPRHLKTIVHTVYSSAQQGLECITLDGIDNTSTQGVAPVITVDNPLFDTYDQCFDQLNRSYMVDFCDGYPSSTGWVNNPSLLEDRNGVSYDSVPSYALFLLGDGILEGVGTRLDLQCNLLSCAGLTPADSELLRQFSAPRSLPGAPEYGISTSDLRPQAGSQTIAYDDFSNDSSLTLNGQAAQFQPDTNHAGIVLRLTPATALQTGSFYLTNELLLGSNGAFSTYFQFQMTGGGGSSDADGAGGDGLVFLVQSTGNTALGVRLGYSGVTNSLAVGFSTFDHGDVGAVDGNYVGVYLNGSASAVASGFEQTRFNNQAVWYAWVDYDGQTLEARWSRQSARPDAAGVSYQVNLDTLLRGNSAYVGFAAGTSTAYETHDIRYWKFINAYQPQGVYTVNLTASTPSNASTSNTLVSVRGQAISISNLDGSTRQIATVTINGIAATLGLNGTFTGAALVVPGQNTIQITATDVGGVTTSTQLVVNGVAAMANANQSIPTEFSQFLVTNFGCDIGLYTDSNGCIDTNEDSVEFIPVLDMQETYGGAAVMLDGSIPSLFELLQACPVTSGQTVLPRLEGDGPRCYTPEPVSGTWVP